MTRCEGEFDRREEDEDCLLIDPGAASVFDLMGIVRTVSFGIRRSAEDVSSLLRFGMLHFRGFAWFGKLHVEGEGEGVRSHNMLWLEEETRGPGDVEGGSI